MSKFIVPAEAFEVIESFCSYMQHFKLRHVARHERDCLKLYKVLRATTAPGLQHPALDFMHNANLWDMAQPASTWFGKEVSDPS